MIGTLKELDVKPGDVVRVIGGKTWEIVGIDECGKYLVNDPPVKHLSDTLRFRIVSRASDTPKAWGDMTDAEKGALLLAKHDGKEIESFFSLTGWVSYQGLFYQEKAYRIKPEPEVITYNWFGTFADGFSDMAATDATHILKFNTINGEPDLSSIKMEKI